MYICKLTPYKALLVVPEEIVCKILKPRSMSYFYRIPETFVKVWKNVSESI